MLSKGINDQSDSNKIKSEWLCFDSHQLSQLSPGNLETEPTLMAFGVKGSGLAQALPKIKLLQDVEVGDRRDWKAKGGCCWATVFDEVCNL